MKPDPRSQVPADDRVPDPRSPLREAVLPAAITALFTATVLSVTALGSDLVLRGFVVLGFGLLALELVLARKGLARVLRHRATWLSFHSIAQTFLVFAILMMLNYVTHKKRERVAWLPRLDWTETGQHTFSPQTESVLKRLESRTEPIRITAFFSKPLGQNRREISILNRRNLVARLLENYAARSKNIEFELIDPERNPQKANAYNAYRSGIDQGTLFYEADGKRLRTNASQLFRGTIRSHAPRRFKGEQVVTSKLLEFLDGKKRTVFVTKGHNEPGLLDREATGFASLTLGLQAESLDSKAINLLLTDKVPEEASVLMILGPRLDFAEAEIEKLEAYVDAGRPLLVALDPSPYLPRLAQFLSRLGVRWRRNVVVEPDDTKHMAGRPSMPMPDLNGHHITDPLIENDLRIVFSEATGFEANDLFGEKYDLRTILQSSYESWGETNFQEGVSVVSKDQEDLAGTVTLAFAISSRLWSNDGLEQKPEDEQRIVILGDSDFLSNQFLAFQGNLDFLLNSIRWLTHDVDRITVRPKDILDRSATISEEGARRVLLGTTLLFPSVFLAFGLTVWWKRRNA